MPAGVTTRTPRTASALLWCIVFMSSVNPGIPDTGAAELGILHQDLRNLVQPNTLGLIALGIGGGAIGHRWDDDVRGDLSDAAPIERLMDVANLYGSTRYTLLATGGLLTVAHAADFRRLQPVASETLRAILLAKVVVIPLKRGVGRQRPDASNNLSFPSGHTANAFALTTVLTRRYGWLLGLPLYTVTAFVAPARIEREKHYFSDVIGGAALGTLAGWAVTRSSASSDRQRQLVMVVPRWAHGYTVVEATFPL